jgi:hypothetical protein
MFLSDEERVPFDRIGSICADPLQKCFMGTSGIGGFDWDGSNERERFP